MDSLVGVMDESQTAMPCDEQVRQLLEHGLQYLRTHGWTKGTQRNERGEVCAIGAVYYGWLPLAISSVTLAAAGGRLMDKVNETHPYSTVAMYNDRSETTQEDIEILFEKTIADL